MMIERRILEALDACRPGSDDLHSADHPELAEAAALAREDAAVQEALARVQHFDQQISSTMEDIELPAGLSARVKARLAASAASNTVPPTSEGEATETTEPVSLLQPAEPTRRRWMWAAVSAVAASVAVSVGIWQLGTFDQVQLTREKFRTLSRELHAQVKDYSDWETDRTKAPAARPFPDDALFARVKGFHPISLPGDRHAVAYDVTFQNHRATVIVYRATAAGLDLVPPRNPADTQGVCVGVWQRNGLLFALVVEGSVGNYRQLLQSNQGTLG